jgi:hypothetical protein
MQHSGGADLTPAFTVSHEMLNSKHKSSSLVGIAGLLHQASSGSARSIALEASDRL